MRALNYKNALFTESLFEAIDSSPDLTRHYKEYALL